jgi:hypothetical protein
VEFLSAFAAGVLAIVVGTSTAHAANTTFGCQKAIAKEALGFVKSELKIRQKCINANLKEAGSCAAPDAAAIQKAKDKLNSGLAKKCDFSPGNTADALAVLGFPGACADANPLDGFTLSDLQTCISTTHEDAVVNAMLPLEYDSTIVNGPLTDKDQSACQKNISKATSSLVASLLKTLQKCRNGLLDCKVIDEVGTTQCKLTGFLNTQCATADPKTADAITKARDKAEATIKKCTDQAANDIKACTPDQTTAPAAATCESTTHQLIVDDPDQSAAFDLLDIEYAKPGRCGDNRQNLPNEECDGTADTACPGQCGSPSGFFSCLCQDKPRTRVVEHANSDLDNGWTGVSHDSGIVEGGGYTSDLWDCDGPGGPDTICNVGPSCSNAPHVSCSLPLGTNKNTSADSLCGAGNTCRVTEAGSQGPHCVKAFKHRCATDADCASLGDPLDTCVKVVPHGAPLPISSGGVSVCVINLFKEDVTGTTDLATGAGAVRVHQDSQTWLGPDQQQPCPVCGGFCSGPGGGSGPGVRNLCTSDADCSGGAHCVTDSVCSWGPNIDQPCRPNPPFGGPTQFFGNPSVDCAFPTNGTFLGDIDILFNPATTGSVSLTANVDCASNGFTNKTCVGGPNEFRTCTINSECPGGTCNEQCFCTSETHPGAQVPNACDHACRGGTNDAAPCADDSECPGGFCHDKDCRVNPSDTDSTQEGLCTVGPFDGNCSVHPFRGCQDDSWCSPVPGLNYCPFCDPGETCVQVQRQCFVNPTMTRSGSPGTPDRVSAAIFCIAGTNSGPVNATAGLPGPGAITQPATTIEVGF